LDGDADVNRNGRTYSSVHRLSVRAWRPDRDSVYGVATTGYSSRFARTAVDLPEVPQARLALGEIPLEPAQRRLLILRRTALGVEMHELECVLEQEVRELAGLNRGIGM
jgi:hypothetical protein